MNYQKNLDFLVSLIMFLTAIFYGCVLPYSFFPGGLIHMPSFSYHLYAAATTAKSLQSCPTLCDPIDNSPPGFPVPGILQARTLEWVAISFSKA